MRVVGGRLGGRALKGPKPGIGPIRPSSDRLRESLFNILAHAHPDALEGARVLDLFAGTGAFGFEAVSRGAVFALLVDDGTEARALLRENQLALGLGGASRIFRRDATKLGPLSGMEPFGLVFADPPYRKGLGEKALAAARDGHWLVPGALVIVEEAADAPFDWPVGFTPLEERSYGETVVRFAKAG
jgi:16S rRNA (guanine966-N2)-methyltransferase